MREVFIDCLNKTTEKELLRLNRKSLTAISKLNLKNITVSVDGRFGADFSFDITVFDKDHENVTFWFYPFHGELSKKLDLVIKALKLDCFDAIKEFGKDNKMRF